MRTLLLASVAAAGPAMAGEIQTCTRDEDVRTIEVLIPGVVGRACDLKVVRDRGAYVSTPYHADNSADFCATRASEIVKSLVATGFECAATAAPSLRAAVPPTDEPAPVADAAPVDPAPATTEPATSASVAGEPASSAAADAVPAASPFATEPEVPAPAMPAAAPEMKAVEAAPPEPVARLEQPPVAPLASNDPAASAGAAAPTIANGGPVALAPTTVSAVQGVKSPRTAAGRIVGATADATPLDRTAPEGAAPAAGPQAAKPITTAMTRPATPSMKARPSEEIIKSVLAAQAAAWNEGDLEAFMGTYWKDPELRFVSGSTVSKGWRETFDHYRQRYGDATTMGRLSFDGLKVDLVTDDVATVTGRFRVDRAAGADQGGFTLVMKRFDGLWRIVHDHTVTDGQ